MHPFKAHLSLFLLFFSFFSLFSSSAAHSHGHHPHFVTKNHLGVRQRAVSSDEDISLASVSIDHALVPRELSGQTSSSASDNDFTCGPGRPCVNGACCGPSGWCGYDPKSCGDGCLSNCDAKAECGEYSDPPDKTCPLNVCCSEFGFCGTTQEFCADGCQSNCEQPKPSVGEANVQQKIIAYWEAWNENKPCGHMTPDEIPVHDITHLIFAFGFVTPDEYRITNMPDARPALFREVGELKNKNPDLKIQIALGGWTHNDPGMWQTVFSDMVSTAETRATFIDNLLGFLRQYGYDGVDFDWEYPGAEDRGGKDADGKNYVKLLKELQAEMQSRGEIYLVTYTAPTSYWYLRHFDIKGMSNYVDWINLMSYDLHGIWDRDNPIGNQILGHTNLTEIDLALDLFWRNDIPPDDIVLGIGFYGRSFKLRNPGCSKPGCEFSDPGDKGKCTDTAGFLSYQEIMDIVKSTGTKPTYDKEAKINYMTYGQNNWISFDDAKTFQDKIDFANERGLNGLMIWAVDLDDTKGSALSALNGKGGFGADEGLNFGVNMPSFEDGFSSDDSSQCRVTKCGETCSSGETAVGRSKSDFGKGKCGGGSSNARWICCPAWTSLTEDDCYWNAGGGAVNSDCSGKCDVGDIKLFGDRDGWKGDLKSGSYGKHCLRGHQSFCCKAGNMDRYLDICTWSDCGKGCPSDKPYTLTTDTGGPYSDNNRCKWYDTEFGIKYDLRKLCCPKKDSFRNCKWKRGGYCSEQCSNGQITLDLDPQGTGYVGLCHNGRQQAFCCDPPGGSSQPFLPVDMDQLFHPDDLPPADSVPKFELVTFGDGHSDKEPNNAGFAFFLIAGSDTAVASMSKRDNPGVHFLDCAEDPLKLPLGQAQTARVICLSGDLEECFGVQKNGVEGTIVKMPDGCGSGTYARAISLDLSKNQSIQKDLLMDGTVSAVYDFTFDYNMSLVRRDAGKLSIRMDYSNVPGYWKAIVASNGVLQKRRLQDLVDRFFAEKSEDWFDQFSGISVDESSSLAAVEKQDLTKLLYYNGKTCNGDNGEEGQGLAVAITGEANVEFFHGFSLIATWDPAGEVEVRQSAGFLQLSGETEAFFTVAGIGKMDTSPKSGGIFSHQGRKETFGGHSVYHGWASFTKYSEQEAYLEADGDDTGEVAINGYMQAKTKAYWGSEKVFFPNTEGTIKTRDFEMGVKAKLTPMKKGPKSTITVTNGIKFGLYATLTLGGDQATSQVKDLPDMSVVQLLRASFKFEDDEDQICLDTSVNQNHVAVLDNGKSAGWIDDNYESPVFTLSAATKENQCWSLEDTRWIAPQEEVAEDDEDASGSQGTTKKKSKRQNNSFPDDGDYRGQHGIPDLTSLINEEAAKKDSVSWKCVGECNYNCYISLEGDLCCNCAWLLPDPPNLADSGLIASTPDQLPGGALPGVGPGAGTGVTPSRRSVLDKLNYDSSPATDLWTRQAASIGKGRKTLLFWRTDIFDDINEDAYWVQTEFYPQYPDWSRNPTGAPSWEGASEYADVKSYFHNSSSTCTSFDVGRSTRWDDAYPWPERDFNGNTYVRGKAYHALYNTEHVLEAQTLSRFFDHWLQKHAATPRQRLWVETYIFTPYPKWGGQEFLGALVDELGSVDNLDRLTVFMARPNQHKGRLFSDSRAISLSTFNALDKGAKQLLVAREIGLIFPYLNHPDVWRSFCDTYNSIMDLMKEFDDWYEERTGAPSNLEGEWAKHVRADLDMVVEKARMNMRELNSNRLFAGVPYTALWYSIMNVNGEMRKVKLDRTDICRNLPASNAGPWTGP